MSDAILLGFSVPLGEPVYLPLHHLAIFGMTQLSGKTTTLEALITRSKIKALAFITKRGEIGFTEYNQIMPYYKPRADWQYVESLVNVALGEKVQYQPFMRWAILQVTKGAPKTLRQVLENSIKCEEKYPRRKEVFEQLTAYLKIVVPELERWQFSGSLELKEGVNVMDLSTMRLETQHLVIASTIEYAFQNLDHVIVIIPEAWETLPQSKMTPVKWVAQQFIRKGAVLGNYLWLDSQDIGGIDKTPLRQCDNWVMGRMKEAHEVERILKQLIGVKVDAKEIQTLPLGHFYAVIGNEVKKVYVLPSGVPEAVGVQVATGKLAPEIVKEQYIRSKSLGGNEEEVYKEKFEKLQEDFEKFKEATEHEVLGLQAELNAVEDREKDLREQTEKIDVLKQALREVFDIESIAERSVVQHNAVNGSVTVNLESKELVANITHEDKVVQLSTDNQQGQIMYVALNDLPREGFTQKEMSQALEEHGWQISDGSLALQLGSNLSKAGLLLRIPHTKPAKYRLPSKVKVNVT
jgi:hypothetical protein